MCVRVGRGVKAVCACDVWRVRVGAGHTQQRAQCAECTYSLYISSAAVITRAHRQTAASREHTYIVESGHMKMTTKKDRGQDKIVLRGMRIVQIVQNIMHEHTDPDIAKLP